MTQKKINNLDIRDLPDHLSAYFRSNDNLHEYYIKNTIGDGSCLIHSVLQATEQEYRNSDKEGKQTLAYNYRAEISELFTEEEFNMYKQLYAYSFEGEPEYNNRVQEIISNPSQYLELEFASFLARMRDINIFLFMDNPNYSIPHCLSGLTVREDRKTILVYYSESGKHFESICRIPKKKTVNFPQSLTEDNFTFEYSDDIVQQLVANYITNDSCPIINGFSNWNTFHNDAKCYAPKESPNRKGYCSREKPYLVEEDANTINARYCCSNKVSAVKLANPDKQSLPKKSVSSKKSSKSASFSPKTKSRKSPTSVKQPVVTHDQIKLEINNLVQKHAENIHQFITKNNESLKRDIDQVLSAL